MKPHVNMECRTIVASSSIYPEDYASKKRSKMTESIRKTTRVRFRLDPEIDMKPSNTTSKQNPVSILKKTGLTNMSAANSAAIPGSLKRKTASKEQSRLCAAEMCISTRACTTNVRSSGCNEMYPELRNLPPCTKLNDGITARSENPKLLEKPFEVTPNGLSRSLTKIGVSQLVIVFCEDKQQVYCQLCSVRLKTSSHSTSFTHCFNYVKSKYPGLTANVSNLEDKLRSIVAYLAQIEKSLGPQKPQRIEVKKDLYLKLAALPEKEAVEELKTIVRQDPLVSSTSADVTKAFQQKTRRSSEVSRIHVCVQPAENSRLPGNNLSEQNGERLQQKKPLCEKERAKTAVLSPIYPIQDNFQPSNRRDTMDSALGHEETVKQNQSNCDTVAAPHHKVTPACPGVKAENADSISALEKDCSKSSSPSNEICSPQKQTGLVQMRPKGLSLKEAPKNDSAPQEHYELQFSPITFYGRKAPGCSNLFLYLQVRELDAEKVIGIDSVWECRGICLDTFFLCESCEETILCRNIFEHMTNLSHQLEYMRKRHPEFLKIFWLQKDLPQALQMNILQEVVRRLAERDCAFKVDAKCIILKQELHQFVRTAQFNEALKIVQNILSEEKTTFHLSSGLAVKAEEKGKRSNLEDGLIVGASAVVKAFSPVKMTSTSLKTNLLDPSAHDPGKTLVQFTNPNAFVKREFKSAVSHPQNFGEELVPETSCSAVKNSLSASVGAQTRKRTAEVSLSLHQLKDPTPAKRTFLLQRLKSEPGSPPSMTPPLNSAAPSSSLAMKDEGSIKATSTLDQDFLLKPIPGMKWQTSKKNHHSALAKDHITGIKSEIVSQTCDSKSQLIKAEAEMNRAFNSIEGNTVPKPDPDYRKEPLSFGASAATISSPEDFLEGNTVTKVIALTEVAPSTDLQNLQFFHSQKICRVESYSTSTNHISGQIPEPKGDLESDLTLISQPSSFKNEILNPDKHLFQGSYEGLTTPCFNKSHQIGFNTCPQPEGSCCAEGYNQHSQLSDISHQQCMYPIYPQPVILFSPTVQLLPGVGVFHIPCYSWAARMGR